MASISYPLQFPRSSSEPTAIVTHPTSSIWILELRNGADNRLSEEFISNAISPALTAVEREWRSGWREARAKKDREGGKGALIIVGNRSQDKFFSNGLDFDNAVKNPHFFVNFFPDVFNPMMLQLLSFPIPTVAAINGHCFAGGMILSLCCDYRVMTDGIKRNAWMCMNEIFLGAPVPMSFGGLFRAKIPDPRVNRKVLLEGHRFTPAEALQAGIVDATVSGGTEAVLLEAQALAEKVGELPRTGTWGLLRRELYRNAVEACTRDVSFVQVASDDAAAAAKAKL